MDGSKSADEHDKILDLADNLDELLANPPVKLSASDREYLSFYLAKQKDKVYSPFYS